MEHASRLTLDDPLMRGRMRQRVARRSDAQYRFETGRRLEKRRRYAAMRSSTYSPTVVEKLPELQPEKIYGLSAALQAIDTEEITSTRRKRAGRARHHLVTGMAVLLCLVGVGAAVSSIVANLKVAHAASSVQSPKTDVASDAILKEGDKPDEHEPSAADMQAHSVAPDMPKLISIPGIQVNARVFKLMTTKTGDLSAPRNIFDTGWYGDSAKPGQNGAMLIDGHSTGMTKVGVFSRLKELKPNDEIRVTRGDNSVVAYSVVTSKVFDGKSVDMNSAMVSADTAKPGLNLITCTGKVLANGDYDQRIIVYAVAK